jgi:hypothetical protein
MIKRKSVGIRVNLPAEFHLDCLFAINPGSSGLQGKTECVAIYGFQKSMPKLVVHLVKGADDSVGNLGVLELTGSIGSIWKIRAIRVHREFLNSSVFIRVDPWSICFWISTYVKTESWSTTD